MLFKDTRFGVKHDHTGRYHCDLSGAIIGKSNNLPYGLTDDQFERNYAKHATAMKKAYQKHGAAGVQQILPPKLAKLYVAQIMGNSRTQARKYNTAALVRHFTTLYPEDPRSRAMIDRSLAKKQKTIEQDMENPQVAVIDLPGYGHYIIEVNSPGKPLLEISLIPLPDGGHLLFTATTAFEQDTNSDFVLEGLSEFSEEEEFFNSYSVSPDGFTLFVSGSKVGEIVFDYDEVDLRKLTPFEEEEEDVMSEAIYGMAMWLISLDDDRLMELMA